MATEILPQQEQEDRLPEISRSLETAPRGTRFALRRLLLPLASLKFTVALFALSIFIVLAGTFAQVDKDIWLVINEYFRIQPGEFFQSSFPWINLGAAFVLIDFQVFFPPSFFPSNPQVPGAIYFPKGWLIGGLMAINLVAAHAFRFRMQAKGIRLWSGLAVIAVGCLVTWMVIASGNNKEGFQGGALIGWPTLWRMFVSSMVVVFGLALYAVFQLDRSRSLERWALVGFELVLGTLISWLVIQGDEARLGDPSMRILWQLLKAGFAGVVLLAGCWMVFKKRAGIVLLHGGIGLMMFSELWVGTSAVEGQMVIQEGETVAYARDIRSIELAVVDSESDPQNEIHTVVPEPVIHKARKKEETIRHEDLPFDMQIVGFQQNSRLRELEPGEESQADSGAGLRYVAEKARPSSGTDTGGQVDISSAYVELTRKGSGEALGTWLFSLDLKPQPVQVEGKTWDVALRFKRMYKPYSLHLLDVRKLDYVGTSTPKDYSSFVRLVDAGRNVDRQVRIWMNNPLRFAGETFYQSGYTGPPDVPVETTTLQVVTNSGWMIPYVSCMIVAVGMLAQFWLTLTRFLNRRAATELKASDFKHLKDAKFSADRPAAPGKPAQAIKPAAPLKPVETGVARWLVPLLVVLVFAGWLGSKARMPQAEAGEFQLTRFGKLPVAYEGRVKPMDTLARNSLRILSEKETLYALMDKETLQENWEEIREKVQQEWENVPEESLRDFQGTPDELAELILEHHPPEGETKEDTESVDESAVHDFVYEVASEKQPAIRWLLDVIARPEVGDRHRVFRIENPEVLTTLGLKRHAGYRYAYAEFEPQMGDFLKQVQLAGEKDAADRSLYDRKIMTVYQNVQRYHALRLSHMLPPEEKRRSFELISHLVGLERTVDQLSQVPLAAPGPPEGRPWESLTEGGIRAWLQQEARRAGAHSVAEYAASLVGDVPQEEIDEIVEMRVLDQFVQILRSTDPELSGPALREHAAERFREMPQNIKQKVMQSQREETVQLLQQRIGGSVNRLLGDVEIAAEPSPAAQNLTVALAAWRDGKPDQFNAAVAEYQGYLRSHPPQEYRAARAGFESWFNSFAPFFNCYVLYIVAFVLTALSWLLWRDVLNRSALWLMTFVLVVHTLALVGRMYISGRAFVTVTNLYSSAVFIGWACVVAALGLEIVYRRGVGNVIAAVAGLSSLRIAHYLSGDGDTFTVMQAVLDTNFWLSTHVTCITLGYAATFLAGLLGVTYILLGLCTPSLTANTNKDLVRMIYGTLCFAIFFSFVGTVLGGLWADDSWGRFWGWDPKENGALMIVLWNALVLHARWGGMVKDRGLAVLAVGGNIVTSWSWFGVNELGVGLHSYGFTEGVLLALLVFVASQLMVMFAGILPKELWWSFRQRA